MQKKEYSMDAGGRTLTATFSDLANQAHGSVLMKYGETVVLVTAVISKDAKEAAGYFPLTVDYEEKFYATGRILGSRFVKREGRPSDEAILTGRVVDRSIRPLFDSHIRNEVHVVVTVLSIDEENDPDVPGIIGASLALGVSQIPWNGPVSAVRIGSKKIDSPLTVNPPYPARDGAPFDLLICGKDDAINMIEAEAAEVPEERVAEAFTLAVGELEKIQKWQKGIIAERGKVKLSIPKPVLSPEVIALFAKTIAPKIDAAIFSGPGKDAMYALEDEWIALAMGEFPDTNKNDVLDYCMDAVNIHLHRETTSKKRRADGRKVDELRPLFAQAGGLSKTVHGAGFFYRGGTHILSVLTLGSPKDSQVIEGMEVRIKKYFMHHYNFPPFSSGETGRMGGANRRAIGHGALAEKALRAIIPPKEKFPYTIRIVSESMASNGSTSMGSVCGSTLALMDGGVPIKNPVAGIAMGVMMGSKEYQILTDIQGPEDEHGDMDFKVAGTREGITAIQLDIKVGSIPVAVLVEALTLARTARLSILKTITDAIPAPRPDLNPSAPRIIQIRIPVDKIGAVIGSGGKVINGIIETTGADIEIEDDGTVYISGLVDAATRAKEIVEGITHEYRIGERFEAEVLKTLDFGIVVKIGAAQEGLVHISEIAPFRIDTVNGFFSPGEKVPVVVCAIDPEREKVSFSIKGADPTFAERKGFTPSTNLGYNGGEHHGRPPQENDRRGGRRFGR